MKRLLTLKTPSDILVQLVDKPLQRKLGNFTPGVDFISCFAPYANLFVLRQTFAPERASQKLGVERKSVYEIHPYKCDLTNGRYSGH